MSPSLRLLDDLKAMGFFKDLRYASGCFRSNFTSVAFTHKNGDVYGGWCVYDIATYQHFILFTSRLLSPPQVLHILSSLPYSRHFLCSPLLATLIISLLGSLSHSLHFPLFSSLVFSSPFSFNFSILFTLHFPTLFILLSLSLSLHFPPPSLSLLSSSLYCLYFPALFWIRFSAKRTFSWCLLLHAVLPT